MSMASIYITNKCNCDKSNWVKYKTKSRRPDASHLIQCNNCGAQWYSKAKYVDKLPYAK